MGRIETIQNVYTVEAYQKNIKMSEMQQESMYQEEQPTNVTFPIIKRRYVENKWENPEAIKRYEALRSGKQAALNRSWSNIKSFAPELVCMSLLILALWVKNCPSDDLCSQCQSCARENDCNIFMMITCKWISYSCQKYAANWFGCF